MIQAFYTSASSMVAQQRNMDVISNNIANSETPGYRMQRAEFKELLYNAKDSTNNSYKLPVGHGAKISAVTTEALPEGVNPYSLTIKGNAYFVTEDTNGARYYTKKGDFKLTDVNGKYYLSTNADEFVLDENGQRIELPNKNDMFVISDGEIYPNGNNGEPSIKPMLTQFANEGGLSQIRLGKFVETPQSGVPSISTDSKIDIGYADELSMMSAGGQALELARMMQTQMAYQVNSKALQIADEMEGIANHLRN